MSEGRIVEIGDHDELLARKNGLYAHLWRLQNGMPDVTAEVHA